MFTGLVEEVGKVSSIIRGAGVGLRVSGPVVSKGSQVGDSIAVNGVCLTITKISGNEISFDAVEETLSRSSLGELRPGSPVNLERSVSADRLFGGHFVLGHVDGLGTITSFDKHSSQSTLIIRTTPSIMRYIVEKGSIAIDGISLTVASIGEDWFSVAVIPHTIKHTTLAWKKPGDKVNLETDILGKYVEKFVTGRSAGRGVTAQLLADSGFLED